VNRKPQNPFYVFGAVKFFFVVATLFHILNENVCACVSDYVCVRENVYGSDTKRL